MPDENRLRGWFGAALTKKLAVVSLPPAFWENDPKRNPDATRLLWAALLLDNVDGYLTVRTIMATEKEERHQVESVDSLVESGINSLFAFIPEQEFRVQIQNRINCFMEKYHEG